MLIKLVFGAVLIASACAKNNSVYYDSYHGTQLNEEQIKEHVKKNTTFWCVNEIEPCDPHEWRRVDGSCNNLKHPSRGASHTPFTRVLPPVYEKGSNNLFEPRNSHNGDRLPLPRPLRTSFLPEGSVPDQVFTQLATHFIVFCSADLVSLHDTIKYILWKPYCCAPRGRTDSDCISNQVPDNDPVHRFSEVRCLNLTRPESFQSVRCVNNGTTPERIVSSTPLVDLSHIYGNNEKALAERGRTFSGGLLKYEVEDGRIWPPSTKGKVDLCLLNAKPVEKRCHHTPEDGMNALIGINLVSIWIWRFHNHVATNLAKVNPCWDDDRLFYTAREIVVASAQQIEYYELLPLLMGEDNLIRDGVISPTPLFRDLYNEKVMPQVSLEYPFVLRWFHMMQAGELRMYDLNGHYLKQFPQVNLTLRTGYLAVDDNMDYITQGAFRQPAAKIDYIVDPDIAETILGPHQRASDVFTSDLTKNRYFGFQPYVKYLEYCGASPIRSFEDLAPFFAPERLEVLKDKYKHVTDIDLLAGIWLEKPVRGGFVPATGYCLMVDQLLRSIVSDRHWYERHNRPHAFSFDQLQEIRKMTISRLLCDVGDMVTKIQPHGFLRARPGNEICSCEAIPAIDFNAWADDSCYQNKQPFVGFGNPYFKQM